MPNYLSNVWLLNEEEFNSFTFTGGKVILIAEEPELIYKNHPAIITAGVLLPPVEAISAELDDEYTESNAIYDRYLTGEDADMYISILIAAAIQQIPIGIMFGRDEINMQFPKMFIDFLYHHYGLVVGIQNKINSYIEELYMPFDLAKLYNMNIIDYETFIAKHPPLPIHQSAISKLAYEQNPIVSNKDFNSYAAYFNDIVKRVYNNGGKFLMDPFISL